MQFPVPPFFHPTTTVFIDDQEIFLDLLLSTMPETGAYRSFTHPGSALRYLNTPHPDGRLQQRWLIRPDETTATSDGVALRFDLRSVENEFGRDARFANISTVVADFEMPAMDGLTCLDQVTDRSIRRILLTGQATERVGLEALNAGRIHQYINKGSPEMQEQLGAALTRFSTKFLTDRIDLFYHALPPEETNHMTDPVFAEAFTDWRHRHGIIEYYYMRYPKGFLTITNSGQRLLLGMQTAVDRDRQIMIASGRDAPTALLTMLRSGSVNAMFPTDDGFYQTGSTADWRDQVVPASEWPGSDQPFHVSIIKDPSSDFVPIHNFLSYDGYLDVIDGIDQKERNR